MFVELSNANLFLVTSPVIRPIYLHVDFKKFFCDTRLRLVGFPGIEIVKSSEKCLCIVEYDRPICVFNRSLTNAQKINSDRKDVIFRNQSSLSIDLG